MLVLAVHDAAGGFGGSAAGGVAQDLNGLVNGLVATALQVGGFVRGGGDFRSAGVLLG